jgi:hypothetical protein
VSRAVLKSDEHTEKASESSLSESSKALRVRIKEEEKRRVRAQVSYKNFC